MATSDPEDVGKWVAAGAIVIAFCAAVWKFVRGASEPELKAMSARIEALEHALEHKVSKIEDSLEVMKNSTALKREELSSNFIEFKSCISTQLEAIHKMLDKMEKKLFE